MKQLLKRALILSLFHFIIIAACGIIPGDPGCGPGWDEHLEINNIEIMSGKVVFHNEEWHYLRDHQSENYQEAIINIRLNMLVNGEAVGSVMEDHQKVNNYFFIQQAYASPGPNFILEQEIEDYKIIYSEDVDGRIAGEDLSDLFFITDVYNPDKGYRTKSDWIETGGLQHLLITPQPSFKLKLLEYVAFTNGDITFELILKDGTVFKSNKAKFTISDQTM
ncbi:hypothetical protein KMW28_15885 [Flammeovirga yaeyamensis]|uniref:Uncharacterized protein n=1 Tax=Flammeovirga yaeyamensis TaxID=367791 RepID=A0AAX1N0X7_9BACT|nr:hypothetical protein [Flammeovirga yaeyamensis]MBB3698511.1 hypothetical protein [Flammeovirga yaeyamensis]NMF34140.1 hypothetical protein [Flammeovirga yaeyamensis]QWG01125.1 hypothetical protein KMW28_15885 [Flammeovirga yaeyamensis]